MITDLPDSRFMSSKVDEKVLPELVTLVTCHDDRTAFFCPTLDNSKNSMFEDRLCVPSGIILENLISSAPA